MKNVLVGLLLVSAPAIANDNVEYLIGRECTIDTYDSHDEGGKVGGFDGDSLHGAYQPLRDQLNSLGYKVRKNDYNNKIHYYTDTEFLVELKMNSGRGNNRNYVLTITNTGKFGEYQKVFSAEAINNGSWEMALSLLKLIPKCIIE